MYHRRDASADLSVVYVVHHGVGLTAKFLFAHDTHVVTATQKRRTKKKDKTVSTAMNCK